MERMRTFNTLKLQKAMRDYISESRRNIEVKTKQINSFLNSLIEENEKIIEKCNYYHFLS